MKKSCGFPVGILLLFVCMNLVGCTLKDKTVELNRYIVEIAESLTEEGTFEVGDIYVDTILYGNFSQLEMPELLAMCKFKNNVHAAGFDRTLAIIFLQDSMEVVAYKNFGLDEVVLRPLSTNAESKILFMGRTTYNDVTSQYIRLYSIEENEWIECALEGVEIQENELCYITDDNRLIIEKQNDEQAEYIWEEQKAQFVFQEIITLASPDIAWEEPIEDAFYDAEEHGYIETKEQHYTNSQGQEGYYYTVDNYYFSDEMKSEKYDLVNRTLKKMYEDKEAEYQTYCEENIGDYEVDESIPNENQRDNYVSWFLVSIPYVGDDYVSLIFNDITYYAGAAHPLTYFSPVTISVETGEIVTPKEVLDKSWSEICATVGMNEQNEDEFLEEYGFYLTDRTLTYIYRTNVFVEEIVIKR